MKGLIFILSGEGEEGHFKHYTGGRAPTAIERALDDERCDGDRWASAFEVSHFDDLSGIWVALEWDGEYFNGDTRLIPNDIVDAYEEAQ